MSVPGGLPPAGAEGVSFSRGGLSPKGGLSAGGGGPAYLPVNRQMFLKTLPSLVVGNKKAFQ